MSVLIKGGRIVTAADDYVADVFVDGERVTLIGESLDLEADRVIDARGKYLLPAASTRTPISTCRSAARRRSTTSSRARRPPRSAARPPTSTSASRAGADVRRGARDWREKADGQAVIDIGFHMAVTDLG